MVLKALYFEYVQAYVSHAEHSVMAFASTRQSSHYSQPASAPSAAPSRQFSEISSMSQRSSLRFAMGDAVLLESESQD